jgi:hypothetical protein
MLVRVRLLVLLGLKAENGDKKTASLAATTSHSRHRGVRALEDG